MHGLITVEWSTPEGAVEERTIVNDQARLEELRLGTRIHLGPLIQEVWVTVKFDPPLSPADA